MCYENKVAFCKINNQIHKKHQLTIETLTLHVFPNRPNKWDGVYRAVTLKPRPKQDLQVTNRYAWYSIEADNGFDDDHGQFSEDCLYLNVYTTNPTKIANMPVSFVL